LKILSVQIFIKWYINLKQIHSRLDKTLTCGVPVVWKALLHNKRNKRSKKHSSFFKGPFCLRNAINFISRKLFIVETLLQFPKKRHLTFKWIRVCFFCSVGNEYDYCELIFYMQVKMHMYYFFVAVAVAVICLY
jgi:hypothetical protein